MEYKNVADRAYFKHIEHEQNHIFDDIVENWAEAIREELLEDKIKEEAYMLHERFHGDPTEDYKHAKEIIEDRLKFLAYHIHEREYNNKPIDNWVKAQQMYIDNF